MDDAKKELVRLLSGANIMLSADIDDKAFEGIDTGVLASKIIEMKSGGRGLRIVTREDLNEAIGSINREKLAKAPVPVEMSKIPSFRPIASDIEADYRVESREIQATEGTVGSFVDYFRSRFERIRTIIESRSSMLTPDIESLKGYANGREVAVVGIVNSKITTKKGNLMVLIEDQTGEAKVMFMNSDYKEGRDLFASGSRIVNDEVIAIRGKTSGPFVIAKEILWPDIPIKEKSTVDEDIAVAFISDMHIGSKVFMERNFVKMLEWLNGKVDSRSRGLAGKIKYLIVGGDIADGIGNYPNQEDDLAILDIYQQYKTFANFVEMVPDYIHVFIMPGNHDAIQMAEPQPPFPSSLIDIKRDNVHMVTNPSYMTLHGLSVLSYHGGGITSMMNAISGLSYSKPEEIMIEMLKRRHMSPIYGGNVIVPAREDTLVIDKVPDIFHTGHIHTNGIAEYHGVQVVNSGTWQNKTAYHIKRGMVPTPCLLPVFEAKRYAFTTVNFMSV